MIKTIKQKYPIAPFVAPYTGGLKSSGRVFFMGNCPFCKKSRVFWVANHLGLCGCFNPGCDAFCNVAKDPDSRPMDVINFHARIKNISNDEAIADLAQAP